MWVLVQEELTTRLSFSTAPFLTGFHLLLFLDSICWYVSLCHCVHANLSELLLLLTMHLHQYLIRNGQGQKSGQGQKPSNQCGMLISMSMVDAGGCTVDDDDDDVGRQCSYRMP